MIEAEPHPPSKDMSAKGDIQAIPKRDPEPEPRNGSGAKDKLKVSPLAVALIAGAVGILGTVVGGILNVRIESQKQEGSLILEAIKTGDAQSAARNLLFFSDAKLITLSTQQIESLKKVAGESTLPVLPRPGTSTLQGVEISTSENLTPEIKKKVEDSLLSFQKYLGGIGFDLGGKKIEVTVDPEVGLNAYYKNVEGKYSITLGPPAADDETTWLQQYAYHILVTSRADLHLQEEAQGPVQNAAWGLADFLNCSHRNDPLVGEILGLRMSSQKPLRNLKNERNFSEIRDTTIYQEAGEVWGGAFWEIRESLGREFADKLVLTFWSRVKTDDSSEKIGQRIVEGAKEIDAQNENKVRLVFLRRGLKV